MSVKTVQLIKILTTNCITYGFVLPLIYVISALEVPAQEGVIEEIVVTARHRAESIQNVPISMSVISGDSITEARMASVQALEHSVPNLVFGETGSSGETFVGIRGIGDFARNIGFDTRVGVYMDGVFVGQSLAVDQGLVDVEQVSVLRGPQGTLFRKNSSSGVININSHKPQPGETSGEFRIGGGNLDTVYGSGILNLPLGDQTAARFSITAQNQDGYIDNILTGDDLMTNDHVFARARLRYQPSEKFDINLSFDYREQDNDLLFLEPDDSYELAVGNPAAVGIRIVDQDAQLIDNNDGWGVSLTADYVFTNDFVLTSITGYRTAERMVGSDEDATRVFTLDARFFEDDIEHVTQELRLASPDDRRLRYVLGFFYFDQKAKTDRVVALGPGFGGPPSGIDAAIQDSRVDTSSFAGFVNANFDLTEQLSVSGGIRYTDEDKDANIMQTVFPGFGLATLLQEQAGRKEEYFTATANIQYQFNDNVLAYATYSHGYKSGGFNVDLVPTAGDLFYDEETVDSFEIGLKTDLFNERLRFNITAYHAEYNDYQVFQFRFDPFSGTTALLVSNAASVTTEGIEVEGIARISENMEIEYGLGYADATFDDFPGGAVDATTGEPVNVAGNTLARSPEVTSSVTGRYRFKTGSLTNSLVLNYTYRSKQYFNPDNRVNTVQKGYGLLNASLDVRLNDQWSLAFFGRNLADKNYRGNRGVSFLGIPFSLYAQPRTYGAELNYRF